MSDLATIVTCIDACGMAGVTPLLVSDPGVGKSSLVRGLAAAQGVPCEVVLGLIREPADFGGLPVVGEDGVHMEAPAWAKRLIAAGRGYALLDELTTVPETTQAAMLGTALDKTVGEAVLPPEVRVVAAANPPEHSSGGSELTPPMANRLCHLDFAPTTEDWIEGMTIGWSAPPASRAIAAGRERQWMIVAQVTGYVRANPHHRYVYPRTAAQAGMAWPSNRSWSMLASVLAHVRDDDAAARQALTFGLVGEGVGVEFLTWVEHMDLPDPVEVIADPSIVDWSVRPDRVMAILLGVVGWASSAGTVAAWQSAWAPLLACCEAGAPDVAAAAARTHGKKRPASAKVPAKVRNAFAPVLAAAGLAA